jgi:phosphoribosyl 1,2-cyclic phosphodiesterase
MKIIFRGVRGSFPVAAAHTLRYGGNTPCIQIDAEPLTILIDAGTGIRAAGDDLVQREIDDIHLLISHTHWDHIQGLPHFAPLYREGTHLHIYSLERPDHSLRDVLRGQQRAPFFPVSLDEMPARITFTELEDGQQFAIGDLQVTCRRLNHPGVACGYRVERDEHAFAYICDADLTTSLLLGDGMEANTESEEGQWLEHLKKGACDLAHCADLMVCDTFFLPEEYKPDWGHSRPADALHLGLTAGVRRIAFFHHDPHRSDEQLDAVLERYRPEAANAFDLVAAAEGMEFSL